MKGLNSSTAAVNLQLEWAVSTGEGVKLLNCCSESPAGMGCFHGCKVCCGVDYPADAEDCRGGAAGNGSLIAETDDGGITSLDRRHAACGLGIVRLDSTVGATLRAPLSGTFPLEGRMS